MNLPENHEILQRYHDGEVSPEEAIEVEKILARDGAALDFLGQLDAMREIAQAANDEMLAGVSFDGLWERVEGEITAGNTAAIQPAQPQQPTLGEWLRALFAEHKNAWVTASATALAVAAVLAAFQIFSVHEGSVQKVVEKHYVYIDSVDNADPDSTVLVSSLKDDGAAVIWLLPSASDTNSDDGDEELEEGVVIEEEPL